MSREPEHGPGLWCCLNGQQSADLSVGSAPRWFSGKGRVLVHRGRGRNCRGSSRTNTRTPPGLPRIYLAAHRRGRLSVDCRVFPARLILRNILAHKRFCPYKHSSDERRGAVTTITSRTKNNAAKPKSISIKDFNLLQCRLSSDCLRFLPGIVETGGVIHKE